MKNSGRRGRPKAGPGVDNRRRPSQRSSVDESKSQTTDSGTRLAGAADADLAADAAAFLGRGQAADAGLRGDAAEINRQARRLTDWARERRAVLSDSIFADLEKHPGATAEHEVFHRTRDNRAVKRTYAGTFGVTPDVKGNQRAATPLFYLCRLALMNQVFCSGLRLEGVAFGTSLLLGQHGLQPCLVISQPWIRAGDPANPHPTDSEIEAFMRSLDFEPLPGSYFGWRRPADAVVIVDARRDNFIKSSEGVVPIDLVVELKPA